MPIIMLVLTTRTRAQIPSVAVSYSTEAPLRSKLTSSQKLSTAPVAVSYSTEAPLRYQLVEALCIPEKLGVAVSYSKEDPLRWRSCNGFGRLVFRWLQLAILQKPPCDIPTSCSPRTWNLQLQLAILKKTPCD